MGLTPGPRFRPPQFGSSAPWLRNKFDPGVVCNRTAQVNSLKADGLTENDDQPERIAVLEETFPVDKAVRAANRVLINTSVEVRTEYAEIELRTGDALIERVPINRIVHVAPGIREEGDTIIVPVLEEIMVVEKRLVLKEEIHIHRREVVQHVREPVQLRSETVSLERAPLVPQERNEMTDLTGAPSAMQTGNQVVAMFETYERARAARDALIAAGSIGPESNFSTARPRRTMRAFITSGMRAASGPG